MALGYGRGHEQNRLLGSTSKGIGVPAFDPVIQKPFPEFYIPK